jgi:hypothetical protein
VCARAHAAGWAPVPRCATWAARRPALTAPARAARRATSALCGRRSVSFMLLLVLDCDPPAPSARGLRGRTLRLRNSITLLVGLALRERSYPPQSLATLHQSSAAAGMS